jgi:hypothetical protein
MDRSTAARVADYGSESAVSAEADRAPRGHTRSRRTLEEVIGDLHRTSDRLRAVGQRLRELTESLERAEAEHSRLRAEFRARIRMQS